MDIEFRWSKNVNLYPTITMQGEHHDIEREFPEYRETIVHMRDADNAFDEKVRAHNELDDQIRRLEEKLLPISDAEFEKLKFRRAVLKDEIFQAVRLESARR